MACDLLWIFRIPVFLYQMFRWYSISESSFKYKPIYPNKNQIFYVKSTCIIPNRQLSMLGYVYVNTSNFSGGKVKNEVPESKAA